MKKFLILCAFVALVIAVPMTATSNVALDTGQPFAPTLTPTLDDVTTIAISPAYVVVTNTPTVQSTTNAQVAAYVVSKKKTVAGIAEVDYVIKTQINTVSPRLVINGATDAEYQEVCEVAVTVHRGLEVDYVAKMPIVDNSHTSIVVTGITGAIA